MSFESDVRAFADKVRQRSLDIVTETSLEVQRSIKFGSELTGAPGQPVDTGNLRESFILERTGPLTAQVTSNVVYGPIIEEGISDSGTPITFKSAVGGAHSIALTRAGWQNIVDAVAVRVVPQS